ncbi:MAG: hypothetical protein WCS73_10440 [Lentisphaeria bacterium]
MRRPIGWVDKDWETGKRKIRVNIHADVVKWQFQECGAKCWTYSYRAPESYWLELEVKLLELKQRGHLFDREIDLVRKLISLKENIE